MIHTGRITAKTEQNYIITGANNSTEWISENIDDYSLVTRLPDQNCDKYSLLYNKETMVMGNITIQSIYKWSCIMLVQLSGCV